MVKEITMKVAQKIENNRVVEYFKRLRDWQNTNETIHKPYFNVDDQPNLWRYYLKEREWLKEEADLLWQQGINVYL